MRAVKARRRWLDNFMAEHYSNQLVLRMADANLVVCTACIDTLCGTVNSLDSPK